MTFERLLERFRALGGVAENVRFDSGARGNGLFAIDSAQPVTIHVPRNLLVPVDAVEVRDGELRVKSHSGVGDAEREFFEEYQREFAWSAGGFKATWEEQGIWHATAPEVLGFIRRMGINEDVANRFAPPSADIAFYRFIRARDYSYEGKPWLAPVLDMANHSATAPGYSIGDGIGMAGTFDGEVLVRYNVSDALANLLTYGFNDLSLFAYSLAITVGLRDGRQLSIKRSPAEAEIRNDYRVPKVEVRDQVVELSHLTLGNLSAPDVPRGILRAMLAPGLSATDADAVFDSIAHFNRKMFLDFLRVLHRHPNGAAGLLAEASVNQLEVLSSAVGACDVALV